MKASYRFLCLVLFLQFSQKGTGQCVIPSDIGDTLFPVINRMTTPSPFRGSYNPDRRKTIYESVNIGNTLYIGGDFQYIGPNTGTGVIMNETGTQVQTYKKWKINGPVYASIPDGIGGYYIGGLFTKIGDSIRYNIAHINQEGVPMNWKPVVNNLVKALVLLNDTLIIVGQFVYRQHNLDNYFG